MRRGGAEGMPAGLSLRERWRLAGSEVMIENALRECFGRRHRRSSSQVSEPQERASFLAPSYFDQKAFMAGARRLIPILKAARSRGTIPPELSFKEAIRETVSMIESGLRETRGRALGEFLKTGGAYAVDVTITHSWVKIEVPEISAEEVGALMETSVAKYLSFHQGVTWAAAVLGVDMMDRELPDLSA